MLCLCVYVRCITDNIFQALAEYYFDDHIFLLKIHILLYQVDSKKLKAIKCNMFWYSQHSGKIHTWQFA